MGWFGRLRHSRGFGIHSPFAFRFVREVIREKLPYYDYSQIPDKRERLAYRLAAFFQPIEIISLGGADVRAPKMAISHKEIGKMSPPQWLGVNSVRLAFATDRTTPDELLQQLAAGTVICLHDRSRQLLKLAQETMQHGMIFDNQKGYALIVPFAKLPKQTFIVKF